MHFCKDYKELKKKKKGLDLGSKKSEEDGDAFIAALATHAFDDVWLIDLSSSFHMTSHKSYLLKYEFFGGGNL